MAAVRCPAIKDGEQCALPAGHSDAHQLAADAGWVMPGQTAQAAIAPPPGPTIPHPTGTAKKSYARLGCAVLGSLFILAYIGVQANKGGSGGPPPAPAGSHLTGAFLSWEPVDDAHGYALFSVTNKGSATETAKCTIRVSDDFGDFGFDSLVGETVGPGATISGRMALSVGKGSFLINKGDVTGC